MSKFLTLSLNDENTIKCEQSLSLTPSLVRNLAMFKDEYSRKLVNIFTEFLNDKDFDKMQKDFSSAKSSDGIIFRNRWDFNIRSLLLEVIYPAIKTKDIYQDGNVFEITYKKASEKVIGRKYIFIDDNLHEILFCKFKYENNVSEINTNVWKRINSGFKI